MYRKNVKPTNSKDETTGTVSKLRNEAVQPPHTTIRQNYMQN